MFGLVQVYRELTKVRNPNHPLFARVQGHIERLSQMRTELLEEGSRKRPAPPVEPTDGLDQAKRQKLDSEVSNTPQSALLFPPPMPQGSLSIAQLFTLTQNEGPRNFDVQAIPIDLLNRIIVPILTTIDQTKLVNAVNVRNFIAGSGELLQSSTTTKICSSCNRPCEADTSSSANHSLRLP